MGVSAEATTAAPVRDSWPPTPSPVGGKVPNPRAVRSAAFSVDGCRRWRLLLTVAPCHPWRASANLGQNVLTPPTPLLRLVYRIRTQRSKNAISERGGKAPAGEPGQRAQPVHEPTAGGDSGQQLPAGDPTNPKPKWRAKPHAGKPSAQPITMSRCEKSQTNDSATVGASPADEPSAARRSLSGGMCVFGAHYSRLYAPNQPLFATPCVFLLRWRVSSWLILEGHFVRRTLLSGLIPQPAMRSETL